MPATPSPYGTSATGRCSAPKRRVDGVKVESGWSGEMLFETYLAEHGYGWERPPELEGIHTRPDYLVHLDQHTVLCEVKSFDVAGPLAGRQSRVAVGARSMKDVLHPHRKDLKEAARQLKPWRGQGWPLVVVLSNPRGCMVPTDPMSVVAAMYGDRELVAPWRDDGSLGDFTARAGRNGKLGGDHHQYLSAVVMLHCRPRAADWSSRWINEHRSEYTGAHELAAAVLAAAGTEAPEGVEVFVDVFETASDDAVPLPRSTFDGPQDRRFAPDASRTAIIQLSA